MPRHPESRKDPRPIWRQIEEGVRHLFASGSLGPAPGGGPSPAHVANVGDVEVSALTREEIFLALVGATGAPQLAARLACSAVPVEDPVSGKERLVAGQAR